MSAVPELTSQTFDETVSQGITLIDFWAEWCGPCKMIAPMIDELSTEYDGKAKVVKINIDNEPDLAVRFNVNSIPTLPILKDGEEAQRFIGLTSKSHRPAAPASIRPGCPPSEAPPTRRPRRYGGFNKPLNGSVYLWHFGEGRNPRVLPQ